MKKKKYILPLAVLISVEDGEILAGSGDTVKTESSNGDQPQYNGNESDNDEEETFAKATSWTFSAGEDW